MTACAQTPVHPSGEGTGNRQDLLGLGGDLLWKLIRPTGNSVANMTSPKNSGWCCWVPARFVLVTGEFLSLQREQRGCQGSGSRVGEAGAVHEPQFGLEGTLKWFLPLSMDKVSCCFQAETISWLSLPGCAHRDAPASSTACQDTALLPQNYRPGASQTSAQGASTASGLTHPLLFRFNCFPHFQPDLEHLKTKLPSKISPFQAAGRETQNRSQMENQGLAM